MQLDENTGCRGQTIRARSLVEATEKSSGCIEQGASAMVMASRSETTQDFHMCRLEKNSPFSS